MAAIKTFLNQSLSKSTELLNGNLADKNPLLKQRCENNPIWCGMVRIIMTNLLLTRHAEHEEGVSNFLVTLQV